MTNAHDTHSRAIAGEAEDNRAPTVEDAWARILRKYADDPPEESATDDQIRRILRALQAHPTLALGGPTRDQIESITTTAIDKLDLVAHGPADNADEADRLAEELKQALQHGLHGDLVGPGALLEPYELQAEPDRIDPTGADGPPQPGVGPETDSPQQMPNDTNPNSADDRSTDNANAPDTDDDDDITVSPADLNPEADANPGAPSGPGAPTTGAAGPAPDEADSDPSESGAPEQTPLDVSNMESSELLAQDTLNMMIGELELDEEHHQVAFDAARYAVEVHQQLLREQLFGTVDPKAREIIFDSTVADPIEQRLRQAFKQNQQ